MTARMTAHSDDKADFGFRTVRAAEKAGLVRGVFDRVAARYDMMNDVMSGGAHRLWKSVMLDRVNPQPAQRLIDVAGGTGDIARGFLIRANRRPRAHALAPARAMICDINFEMLQAGRARAERAGVDSQLSRICGDAECLPVPDAVADAYTVAFGIRNVTDRTAALAEAHRVLKPGGRFACLEFSHMATEGLQKIYDAYSFNIIPWLGARVANDRASYQYLVESIRRFPAQDAFAAEIRQAGFARVGYENLTAGVAALHLAWKI